jgi:hypothetical protein
VFLLEGFPGEATFFIANIILTQCLEGLGYVHSVSLRWALLKENRLVFNTNVRLFTSSKISRPNTWYMNFISAMLLILCHGATSCYYNNLCGIPSWSSNPLNTTVTMLRLQSLWHRAGRCIVPAQIPDTSKGTPIHPKPPTQSMASQ